MAAGKCGTHLQLGARRTPSAEPPVRCTFDPPTEEGARDGDSVSAFSTAAMTLAGGGALDPAGPAAETIEDLWWVMAGLGAAVFAVFAVALGIALTRGPREGAAQGAPRVSDRWVVGGGVVLPAVVLVVVLAATLSAMRALPEDPGDDALSVEITGFQWRYEVAYPDEGVDVVDELHLPVGRPVALHLTSEDVIHSFWVPELGGKLDMLPDGTNVLVLQADEPGEWDARCAEFCGERHASMQLRVVAEPPDAFEAWLAEQR
jgi:cytochrome c oxidase subunit 2